VCPGHVFKWGKRGGAALSFYGLESKPREEGGTQFGMAHSKKKMGGGGGGPVARRACRLGALGSGRQGERPVKAGGGNAALSCKAEVGEACSGTWCGAYYLIPRRLTTLIERKILDNVVDEVSEALSMHVVPPAIRIVVVPAGATVLLGLHNSPPSLTGTVGPPLPGFTIAPCVDSLLCYRLIRRPKSILQDSPKS
jgi:hypothetical protein